MQLKKKFNDNCYLKSRCEKWKEKGERQLKKRNKQKERKFQRYVAYGNSQSCRLFHPTVSLSSSTSHCRGLSPFHFTRTRFPRYSTYYTTSTSSYFESMVCQPSSPPCFSCVLVRRRRISPSGGPHDAYEYYAHSLFFVQSINAVLVLPLALFNQQYRVQ